MLWRKFNGDAIVLPIKDAVEEAYNSHLARKVAEHLPTAHEQYLFNRKMGFSTGEIDEWGIGLKENIKKAILNGRELNGEPRDLNF